MIAPCGINCRLCRAYGRDKNLCPGCRGYDSAKSRTRVAGRIKNWEKMVQCEVRYCFGSNSFPCDRLNHLDKRYRTRYAMNMIGNLVNIKKVGIRQFIRSEKEKWACPE